MKKLILLSVLAAFSILTACSKLKKLADINVDLTFSQQMQVPIVPGYTEGMPLPMGITIPFPAIPVATNSKEFISSHNTAANMIVDVNLKSLTFQITTPATQNFDFMDTVQLYISSKTQPEVLVAYKYGIQKSTQTIEFYTITAVNLKNYFVEDTMYFRISAHVNAIPSSGTNLNLSSVLHVLANPLN